MMRVEQVGNFQLGWHAIVSTLILEDVLAGANWARAGKINRVVCRCAENVPLAVAIPAKNEEDLIVPCLRAVAAATVRAGVPGGFVVVVNNTRDQTFERAEAALLALDVPFCLVDLLLAPEHAHVGTARRLSMDIASHITSRDGWLFTTDADSCPDIDWIKATLCEARAGADLVCGLIEADALEPTNVPRALRDRIKLEQEYARLTLELKGLLQPGEARRLRHPGNACGASLACRNLVYRHLGGMTAISHGEDRTFAAVARRRDWRIRFSDKVRVTTASRIEGRAPGGMAETIAARSIDPDKSCDESLEAAASVNNRAVLRRTFEAQWRRGSFSSSFLQNLLPCPDAVRRISSHSYVGEAWAWLESRSPLLAYRPVDPTRFKAELGSLRRFTALANEQGHG